MRIKIVTGGSRGDIQPYVALGLGLQRAGHMVKLIANPEYQEFISSYGLDFVALKYTIDSDWEPPQDKEGILQNLWKSLRQIIDISPNHADNMDSYSQRLRFPENSYLPELYQVCQGADAIIFGPNLFQTADVAEKLGVPCFAAPVQPQSYTRAFPHPYAPSFLRLGSIYKPFGLRWGGIYNWLTYIWVDQVLWKYVRQPINQWRKETLNLPPVPPWLAPIARMHQRRVPFLYCQSPSFLPKPSDWPDWVYVTGCWIPDPPADWQPPVDLVDFLASGPPPVFIGFSNDYEDSVMEPEARMELVLEALARTGQRGILVTGWEGISNTDLPNEVFKIKSVPHTWLFPQVQAVVHHGGSGVTFAGLHAGVPAVTVPVMGDHFFWGYRLAESGIGIPPIPPEELSVEWLTAAIETVTSDKAMQYRAAAMGQRIRAEDGVAQAIKAFHHHLSSVKPNV